MLDETLFSLRRHISVAHHVPGRIRLKFSLSVLDDPRARELIAAAEEAEPPAWVLGRRLNKFGRSLVVEYDPAVVDHRLLEEALTTSDEARFMELAETFAKLLPERA